MTPNSIPTVQERIDNILNKYANGDPLVEQLIRTKFFLRGIYLEKLGPHAPYDPVLLTRIEAVDKELEKIFG
ncbi:MAG: hypothetical protein EAZ57_01660 [Cytophagales bacterium]|nr:MAG: hypothetical protein EAZ67_01615 [Cytophagales bacterium]TAF62155.1 MAG: hypothetical protein EAZ57_01660 [Cytophagales bacterium]